MATFKEAEQVRLSLKMKLSNYGWYKGSSVVGDTEGYSILVHVTTLNNFTRKTIPPVLNSVSIKTEVE